MPCYNCPGCHYPWNCDKPSTAPASPSPFVSGRYDRPCGSCESYDCDLDCSPNDDDES